MPMRLGGVAEAFPLLGATSSPRGLSVAPGRLVSAPVPGERGRHSSFEWTRERSRASRLANGSPFAGANSVRPKGVRLPLRVVWLVDRVTLAGYLDW